jgi:hypothetical protein
MSVLVMPPTRRFKRARHWQTFERLFQPLPLGDGSLIRDPAMLPQDADPRYWWTVLDPMTGTLYLTAGFHRVNRLGYICCANPWGGDAHEHPEYIY